MPPLTSVLVLLPDEKTLHPEAYRQHWGCKPLRLANIQLARTGLGSRAAAGVRAGAGAVVTVSISEIENVCAASRVACHHRSSRSKAGLGHGEDFAMFTRRVEKLYVQGRLLQYIVCRCN
jgi:hypothetical protein